MAEIKKCDVIQNRILLLRKEMLQEGLDWVLIPTGDYHNSEYICEHFKIREFLSGFTGSNATLLVSLTQAILWTDGRYFIQAEKELFGTGIDLYRMNEDNVPTVLEFIKRELKEKEVLGVDGRIITASMGKKIKEAGNENGAEVVFDRNIVERLWNNRPELPENPVYLLPQKLAGISLEDKLEDVRKQMKQKKASCFFLSKLDDIMWLFNIRGQDIKYNPVALSFALITEKKAYLFLRNRKVIFPGDTVEVRAYEEVECFLRTFEYGGNVLMDGNNVSYLHYQRISQKAECLLESNMTEIMKAVKNPREQENLREVFLRDSVAVTKFIYWLKTNIGKIEITEVSASDYLQNLRSQMEGYMEDSFQTICAFGENAAMMHYEPSSDHEVRIEEDGILLVDSGGQYKGGTTDVTRTIFLGKVQTEWKRHFTAVAAGMLTLTSARFLYGCTGRNLDILARGRLWEQNLDYKCGTGHGVGYMLNVHEGPQNIRWRMGNANTLLEEAVLQPGMVVTNEPGVYIEGSHGIRTENVMICQKGEKNEYGQFLFFETLTYVPIDVTGLDFSLMTKKEITLLNTYHDEVYHKISPFLSQKERDWLAEITKPVPCFYS